MHKTTHSDNVLISLQLDQDWRETCFSTLELFTSGPDVFRAQCDELGNFCARFHFNQDISSLFPYINSEIDGALFYRKPQFLRFTYNNYLCALYPHLCVFGSVVDYSEATDYLHDFLDFLKGLQARSPEITPNHKKYTTSSALDIYSLLPATNCQVCGFKSCLAFAAALSRQKTSTLQCPYIAAPIEEKSVYVLPNSSESNQKQITLSLDTNQMKMTISSQQRKIKELQDQLSLTTSLTNQAPSNLTSTPHPPLSTREIEVLTLLSQGATNRKISSALNISVHTVKSHTMNIFLKLGVNDRTQASVWAVRSGLV